MTFSLTWFLAVIVLVLLYGWVGRSSRKTVMGVFVDDRERISLNHFQLVLWTILVLATLIAAFVSSGFDATALEIPQELLILIGISVGSGVASGAVKSVKDAPGSPAKVARGNPRPAQVFLAEEGAQANQTVSISKFQNFVFTVVAALAYVVLTLRAQDYPALPEQVLWLIGISHAGYIAGKIPNA